MMTVCPGGVFVCMWIPLFSLPIRLKMVSNVSFLFSQN